MMNPYQTTNRECGESITTVKRSEIKVSADWQTVSKENVKSVTVLGCKAKQTFQTLNKGKGDFVSSLLELKPVVLKTIIFQVTKQNTHQKKKKRKKLILYLV